MLIRLILPMCSKVKNTNKKYCEDSLDIKQRMETLQNSMKYESLDIDLIVTSNNFFEFPCCDKLKLNNLLNELTSKKELIIGVDYQEAINPFDGISSQILNFVPISNKYNKIKTIWEVWNKQLQEDNAKYLKNAKNKILNLFRSQDRVIKTRNKKITLLSCGDMLKYINFGAEGLPETDVYIDLAHLNIGNWNIVSKKNNNSNIQEWMNDKTKILLVTQQLTIDKLTNNHFFEDNKYKLIYPENAFKCQEVHFFDNKHKRVKSNPDYIFIDVEV